MPLLYLKEIWTPLKLISLRLYKSEEGNYYYKFRKKEIKRIGKELTY